MKSRWPLFLLLEILTRRLLGIRLAFQVPFVGFTLLDKRPAFSFRDDGSTAIDALPYGLSGYPVELHRRVAGSAYLAVAYAMARDACDNKPSVYFRSGITVSRQAHNNQRRVPSCGRTGPTTSQS